MIAAREFVPGGHPLQRGLFYIPRLGRHVVPPDVPITLMRFAARFRATLDAELQEPKHLDLQAQFGRLADWLHELQRDAVSEKWRFVWSGTHPLLPPGDLTGVEIDDPRLAPFNERLHEKLAQMVDLANPFYAMTHLGGASGDQVIHRLFVPMS